MSRSESSPRERLVGLVDGRFVDGEVDQARPELQLERRTLADRLPKAVVAQAAASVLGGAERVLRVSVATVDGGPVMPKRNALGNASRSLMLRFPSWGRRAPSGSMRQRRSNTAAASDSPCAASIGVTRPRSAGGRGGFPSGLSFYIPASSD